MLSSRSLLPLLLSALVFVSLLPQRARGAALTTIVHPQERSCFYAWVDKVGEKIGFYFAVQSGGSFDIDYEVASPSDKVVVEGKKDRQADLIFTGNEVGEYAFCFENDMSTFAEKLIDFDITVESEPRLELPQSNTPALSETTFPLEDSIFKVGSHLTSITRTQRYFRTRENRNYNTVVNTQSRIFWYSVIESLIMISISVAQVFVVKHFFNTGSTKRYRV